MHHPLRLTQYTGVWTLIRNEALCNESLAERGFEHGLDRYITKDYGTPVVSKKMMATAVEALLGAVHLDGGDGALSRVMGHLRIVDPFYDSVMSKYPPVQLLYCADPLRSTYVDSCRSVS
jgi:dsRNA-specific ribonuclease